MTRSTTPSHRRGRRRRRRAADAAPAGASVLEPVTDGWNPARATLAASPPSRRPAVPERHERLPGTVTALAPPTGQAPADSVRPSTRCSPARGPRRRCGRRRSPAVQRGNGFDLGSAAIGAGAPCSVCLATLGSSIGPRRASRRLGGPSPQRRRGDGGEEKRPQPTHSGGTRRSGASAPGRSAFGVSELGRAQKRSVRTARSPCVGVRGCALLSLIRCTQEIDRQEGARINTTRHQAIVATIVAGALAIAAPAGASVLEPATNG